MFFFKKKLINSDLSFSSKLRSLIFSYNLNTKSKNLALVRKSKPLNIYFSELLCQLKKYKCKLKRKVKFMRLLTLSSNYLQKTNRFLVQKTRKRYDRFFEEFDPETIINLLKVKSKFQYIHKKGFKYCKLFFKYTGSNFFGTITDFKGNVSFAYSSGFFLGLRTRKEKTTIFVVKQLGELLALRLSKCNAGEIIFIPLINHRKIRTFLRFLSSGLKVMNTINFVKMIPKRKVMRNGVRLRKATRK